MSSNHKSLSLSSNLKFLTTSLVVGLLKLWTSIFLFSKIVLMRRVRLRSCKLSSVSCRWSELGWVSDRSFAVAVRVFGARCQHRYVWWIIVCALKPRLHQGNMLPGNMGNKLLVRATWILLTATSIMLPSNMLPGNMLPWCKCGLSVCWKHNCLIEAAALSDFCLLSCAVYKFS